MLMGEVVGVGLSYNNRKKRFWNLVFYCSAGNAHCQTSSIDAYCSFCSLGCTVIMFMASYENYPSGYALKDLHRMGYAANNSNEQWVHIDSFSAMNGISRFCENDFPWRYT
ncbi:dol-P-Man:Man(7)GlcNAc(2)-PP-Dol alpha-1,6-mannosyltransferase-like [Cornus florida]|uniref:dol-P-Man:Man(7)GlcNAc(2)-PP-Dol alpha-1,6-mannosyltransferase-like n=1 Tax=Cornus florida TaxID=4283 RepID=UPI0028990702|nr:dol-P-Man:Man(7)GlcNAc(2)-PP-Dol alpha-1,6-mannosyltransferase-like [Cornus florida]